jgi:tetratricopeptide (TPR) repeat protein
MMRTGLRACQVAALALALLVVPLPARGEVPTASAVARAQALFQRYDLDLTRIDRAREILERAVAADPSVDALLLLSWVDLTWADVRATTPAEKLAGYQRGRDAAERALTLEPGSAEAHLWHAANLGRWAILRGRVRAAFVVPTLRKEIDSLLGLAPSQPAVLSLAGSFYLEVPRIMGGDVGQAEAYQRNALAADPHFTRARVELAKCLIAQRRYAEARRELHAVLDEPRPSYYADWAVRHRPAAARLLEAIRQQS